MDIFASNKLSQKNEKTKFIRGAEVLIYWLISPLWLSIKECPSLFINFIVAAILFTGWYYGILAAFMIAMGQTNSFFGGGISGGSKKDWIFWGSNERMVFLVVYEYFIKLFTHQFTY